MKTKMTSINFRFLKALLLVDLLVIAVSVGFFDTQVLWNTQIGYFSSAVVLFASLKAYARMVNARVENNIITYDDSIDMIDKIEDPYDLYSEEVTEEEVDLQTVVKEERQKLKASKRNLQQTLKDSKAALSVYRLGAYVLLIIGFLYLNRHGLLDVIPYVLALSVPMLVMVFVLLSAKEDA